MGGMNRGFASSGPSLFEDRPHMVDVKLKEAKVLIENWGKEYNEIGPPRLQATGSRGYRPHSAAAHYFACGTIMDRVRHKGRCA
jgi:hypothetical protein